MEKPNFDRLADVYAKDIQKSVFEYEKNIDSFSREKKRMIKQWKAIEECKTDNEGVEEIAELYKYNDIIALKNLCEEYEIGDYYPDLRFIAFDFNMIKKAIVMTKNARTKSKLESSNSESEVLSTLSTFLTHKNGISINFIRKQRVVGSINSKELLDVIYAAVLDHFKKNDLNIKLDLIPMSEIENDWLQYINFCIYQKGITIKEDKTWHIKHCVFILWTYLQYHTPLKSKEGSDFSNEQGRFIFALLEIVGIIDKTKNVAKKADVIGYYLKTYRNLQPETTTIKSATYNSLKNNANRQFEIFKSTLADKQ